MAQAQIEPRVAEPLTSFVVAPAGFNATPAPEPLASISGELDPGVLAAVTQFTTANGANWKFYVDRRSGGMALVEGSGIPWIPGSGNGLPPGSVHGSGADGAITVSDLASRAASLMRAYPALFNLDLDSLVLDTAASRNFGEENQFWAIVFRQQFGTTPVLSSRVVFHVSHGNLVQFGVDRAIPASFDAGAITPLISAAAAKLSLGAHIGGILGGDVFSEDGTLLWVLRGASDIVGFGGAPGTGWTPELVYRFTFTRPGLVGEWQALVSALTGNVLRFIDANDYAVLAKGSVYTFTNCTDVINCVPGSATEVPITMPFTQLLFTGGTCSGDDCYTNSAGAFEYPAGATSASTSLSGKYFEVVDGCGAIAASGVAPDGLDLGTTLPTTNNTDCMPANRESSPGTGAIFGGTGDTHAARNTYYHLNLINQKARFYLAMNDWLKGVDGSAGPVLTTTNSAPACNAFWQGGTGSLNFQRVTAALSCNNTGELPDVFLHEFGHGLDQNDGTGTAPESATGEAMGDTFALLEGQHSCIGVGFRLDDPLDPAWGHSAGYGTRSALCSGVRDIDYTRHCYKDVTAQCLAAPLDVDAQQGSRSGFTPPAQVADAGTPARWNHMLSGALPTADGKSNFYNCGGPETTGCAGPLNHGCHCESTIASQSNWDLAKQLIATEFGGDIYAVPQGNLEVSGWQYMDRLWYLTRDIAVSGYSVTGPEPDGQTNGCGISNWFSTYRLVDDDDGNLANGTPHADIIFSAFDLHATACGAAADPSNQGSGCGTPLPAPVLTACDNKSPVQLTWTEVPGATQYRVLRNTLGSQYGFQPIAIVSGSQHYFEDVDVAPGVSYFYSVQPVGANASCYGTASVAIEVVPSTCAVSTIQPPATVSGAATADNQITVSWESVAGAASYKIYRKLGASCDDISQYTAIGVVLAPLTQFVDTIDLQGSFQYSYRIVSSDTTCASCASAPSVCATVRATGTCAIDPTFAGVGTVSAGAVGSCSLTIDWEPATPTCGTLMTYRIYRSTDPSFVPAATNLLVQDLLATNYVDTALTGGVRYYYIVRAVDGFGNEEDNLVRISEVPVGSLTAGTFTDDAGDTGVAQFIPSPTLGNQWAVRDSDLNNPTKQYATSPAGNYPGNACEGLESPTLFLGANPTLTFSSRFNIEQGWDGGFVEVSTEAGGFSDWTKLETVNYPGVMAGPLGDPACALPGFADGEPVFTGQSIADAWATYSGSLSAYANQRVRVRFLFSSDGATDGPGWFVDDIAISDVMVPGACAGVGAVAVDLIEDPTGNGVVEPGETATLETSWRNVSGSSATLNGSASNVQGPPGADYSIVDASADYGLLNDLQTKSCGEAGGDCFAFSVSNPAVRPALHWDGSFDETLNTGEVKTWLVHIGASFTDVPTGHGFYPFIERLVHEGITAGCGSNQFCMSNPTTRAQMAVFLLRAKFGPTYFPPPATGTMFNDVPANGFAAAWIEELARLQITAGCGGGNYCPNNPVTRAQMAVFLLATKFGANHLPPPAQGIFDDVPTSSPFARWIEELYNLGITAGCGPNLYCPSGQNTRGQMAVFLGVTFNIE